MAYTPNVWRNGFEGGTPITAEKLTRLEDGLTSASAKADAAADAAADANGAALSVGARLTSLNDFMQSLNRLVTSMLGFVVPVGAAVPFWGLQEPDGWLLCKGQAVSRTTYKELFAVIGVRSGAGDGSTTFNVPDLRESLVYGVGDSGSFAQTMGAAVGEKSHTLTLAEMPSHSHPLSTNNQAHSFAWGASGSVHVPVSAVGGAATGNQLYTQQGPWNATAAVGGGQAFPMRPRGVVANYIIRAK